MCRKIIKVYLVFGIRDVLLKTLKTERPRPSRVKNNSIFGVKTCWIALHTLYPFERRTHLIPDGFSDALHGAAVERLP